MFAVVNDDNVISLWFCIYIYVLSISSVNFTDVLTFLLARINHLLFPKSRFVFHPKNGGVIMTFLLLSR